MECIGALDQHAYYHPNEPHVRVPESIEFGALGLLAPTLREVGLPEILAKIPTFKRSAIIGSWVERGDALLEFRIPVFCRKAKPPWWKPWLYDSYDHISISICSPASGLLLAYNEAYCAYVGNGGATDSGESLCYGKCDIRPVLLLPSDEPPACAWSTRGYRSVVTRLSDEFENLYFSSKYGPVRLGEGLASHPEHSQIELNNFLQATDGVIDVAATPGCVGDIPNALRFVDEMRAHDLVLRKKLNQLTSRVQ